MSDSLAARANKFAVSQCLPLGLVFALIAGAAIPWIGYRVGQGGHVAIFCVVGLFFIAGLRLKTDEAKKALASIKTCCIGLLSILVLTCIIGAGLTEMLPIRADFKLGLIIFFCTPCTVNTGAMYARQAGGNFAMALLLTVAGNVLGIFTCPIMLHLFADFDDFEVEDDDVADVELDVTEMIWKLTLTVFVPMMAGKYVQGLSVGGHAIQQGLTKYNQQITFLSNGLLITIPWMTFSKSAFQGVLAGLQMSDAAFVILWTSAVHVLFLAFNYALGMVLHLELELHKSLVMVGSSKTLPMALSVLTFLPPELAGNGLIAVPMIIAQMGQIIIDGFVAVYLGSILSPLHDSQCAAKVADIHIPEYESKAERKHAQEDIDNGTYAHFEDGKTSTDSTDVEHGSGAANICDNAKEDCIAEVTSDCTRSTVTATGPYFDDALFQACVLYGQDSDLAQPTPDNVPLARV